jgi:5-methylcytosine-specific restriction endonuclease McrA
MRVLRATGWYEFDATSYTPNRDGGKTETNNLIALCFNCHHRVDDTKTIPKKEIKKLKGIRYIHA